MGTRVLSKTVFMPSPGAGIGARATTYYTRPTGGDMLSIHTHTTRSDTLDVAFVRRSTDNGRTWGKAEEWPTLFPHPDGTGRRHPRGGYVDPLTGRYVTVWTQGVLPTDDPIEGMRQWTVWYSVSDDGAQSQTVNEQIIHEGDGYDAIHHLPGITTGKNCAMIGDLGQRPLTRSDGVILVPIQSSPIGPDGDYANPRGGLTYTDCLLLMGTWRPDGRLAWTASDRVVGDPARTTRGMIEPTIAELSDGRILMVMRGSNDQDPALPGHRWISLSADAGHTWTSPEPWAYTDGIPFFSPSSCSQLIPWRDGRLFWMGNICEQNPRGNGPRYPIVLVEVDRTTGLVIKDSIVAIDDRQSGESERLTLSNFYAREDRESGELLLHMTRFFAHDARAGGKPDWSADALLYRIDVSQ